MKKSHTTDWASRPKAVRGAAYDEIRRECTEIDLRAEFENIEETETLEARVLLKIGLYEDWRKRHGVSSGRSACGGLSGQEVLRTISHPDLKRTPKIEDALASLRQRDRAPGRLRHEPEEQIDRDLDAYEERLRARAFGPPTDARRPSKLSKEAAAREIPCAQEKLDEIAMRRLRQLMKVYPPGMVEPAPPNWKARQHLVNPAVEKLLAKGLMSFKDGLPEDPLYPKRIDVITVCDAAGIGVTDIYRSKMLAAKMEVGRGDKPLVPHPLLAERRYTYGALIEWARHEEGRVSSVEEDEKNEDLDGLGEASRKQVHALRGFLSLPEIGGSEDYLVPYDFKERIERAVLDHPTSFAPGWRGLVSPWIEWNDAFRGTMPLPDNFALTLRILCREVATTPAELKREFKSLRGDIHNGWATGASLPTIGAEPMVEAIANRLRVPLRVLKRDLPEEWRRRKFALDEELASYPNAQRHLSSGFNDLDDNEKKAKIEENHWRYVRQGSPFGRRQSKMSVDHYALPSSEWQPEMLEAWLAMIPARKDEDKPPLRRFGEGLLARDEDGKAEKEEDGWREATILFKEESIGALLGFLGRSRDINDDDDESASEDTYKREGGLGIPAEFLKPGILALTDLSTAHGWWRVRRSGKFVGTIVSTFKTVANMLRPEIGSIWKSPAMLADLEAFVAWWDAHPHETIDGRLEFDIEPFRKNWKNAVEAAFETLKDDIERALMSDLPPSRDTFLPVGVFIDHPRPMELYMVGIRALLAGRPYNIESKNVHTRDCVAALILIQTGLRAYNMLFTFDAGDGGPKVRRRGRKGKVLEPTLSKVAVDGQIKWIINIPSSEFKNWKSAYFKHKKPYEYELRDEDGLYKLLERYATMSRPYMLRGRKSDAFFISNDGHDMTESALGVQHRNMVARYFVHNPDTGAGAIKGAMIHSVHAVRNVIATHIVKTTGDLYLAAWAIQDSPATVEKHYARFIPKDKAEHAARVLEVARAAGRLPVSA